MNENSLKQLKPNKSPWKYPHTKVIRIPCNIVDEVLEIAHRLDNNQKAIKTEKSTVTVNKLKLLLTKIENKESGYKANSATKLIKELQLILNEETIN